MFVGVIPKYVEDDLLVLADDFVRRYSFGSQSSLQDPIERPIEKVKKNSEGGRSQPTILTLATPLLLALRPHPWTSLPGLAVWWSRCPLAITYRFYIELFVR